MAVGDGRTFDQALRALDKLIAEQNRSFVRDSSYSVRGASARIVGDTYGGATGAPGLSRA
jgi:hypothetical protein